MTLRISDTQHNNTDIMLSVAFFLNNDAECHSAGCRYAEGRGAFITILIKLD